MQNFKKLFFLLTFQERKHAGFLLIMVIIMALLDVVGVASILPFIAVLSNPNFIETNFILNNIFEILMGFGVKNTQEFIFVLGVLSLVLLVISLCFKAFTIYLQLRFVQMCQYSLSKRLVEGYLNQPYSWYLSRSSADLGKIILSEVAQVIEAGLNPLMEIISKGFIVTALVSLLLLVDPKLALIIGLVLGGAYVIIFYLVNNYLKIIGKKRLKNNLLRFKVISESFSAPKEVKIRGLEEFYVNKFSNPAKIFAKTLASSQIVSQLPRFILESIAFGGILLILLYTMTKTETLNNSLPIITLYAFAGYRLMPALQSIYVSFTSFSFSGPSLDKLNDDFVNLKKNEKNKNSEVLKLNKTITLKNIYYNYPNTSREVLKDINLTIPVKSTVGIMGTTGSGKTTIVDIILGLLRAKKGNLEVDGKVLTEQNLRAWQRSIGYVPQQIFLSDNTLKSNIAFGIELDDINQERVEKAAKIANLHDFVVNDLPEKYVTQVGENGVRLSGGERQRIGIARALYFNPKILIFDEATSALDNQTEEELMKEIYNLSKDITIIIIAHRINTLKKCDTIFKIEKGEIVEHGTYKELFKKI